MTTEKRLPWKSVDAGLVKEAELEGRSQVLWMGPWTPSSIVHPRTGRTIRSKRGCRM
jgi:hypothetical protein